MLVWIKLIRLPNLVVLAISVYLLLSGLIQPILLSRGIELSLSLHEVLLLIFVVICMAIAGYIQNDIEDISTDHINQKRGILGIHVSKKWGYFLYTFFVIAPIIPALSLALEIGRPDHLYLYFLVTLILFIYNKHLKRMPLIGNVIIGLLCGLVMLLPLLAEASPLAELYDEDLEIYLTILSISLYYSFFSFYVSTIREIVKDVEDIVGDQLTGLRTLPIVLGEAKTKVIIIILMATLLFSLIYWIHRSDFLSELLVIGYLLLIFPWIIIMAVMIFAVKIPLHYGRLSQAIKLYTLLALVFLYLISQHVQS